MTMQHTRTRTRTHHSTGTETWADPTMHALRRAQPPPSEWHTTRRRGRRFWAYLAAAAILAALVPITVALGVNLADSGGTRLLAAIAIPAVAGLAVHASASATSGVPTLSRRGRRTLC